ncbi:hypothetical protein CC86DRAFT_403238 [Ophiobolus disseminans]|uniref:Uncharacterized protein n=1 Tax=Ophiobolus disseminans TaxID=1469910 RepID=A0A6A7A9C7_9PLEO|nr:hypothetical protein CC86DRAFT_403238 [Ophiobolus disseminans]
MNIIKRLMEQRIQAKRRVIPVSRLNGICALPVELWIMVIEHVVHEQLGDPRFPCYDLDKILRSRLVCHVFDREIQYCLDQNITQPRIPRLLMMRTFGLLARQETLTTFHTRLLASAIYNSSRSPRHSSWHKRSQMTHRIWNCMRIASILDSPCGKLGTDELMRRLCNAASASIWCREYMYLPELFAASFESYHDGDPYVEVALLVACGYSSQDVLDGMLKLAKRGKLKYYRVVTIWGGVCGTI